MCSGEDAGDDDDGGAIEAGGPAVEAVLGAGDAAAVEARTRPAARPQRRFNGTSDREAPGYVEQARRVARGASAVRVALMCVTV